MHVPEVEPSGWAFEHENRFYPDTDDTMMVLMALRHVAAADHARRAEQTDRALKWLLAFQCRDGGWAAFDKDVTARWLEHVPFADHNAILDPTCSDLTGRVLELLGLLGFDRQSSLVRRAVAMIRRTQEADGSWYGRWGVNYIYGTWQILRGLSAIGENMDQEWIRRGATGSRAARTTMAAGEKPANPTIFLPSKGGVRAPPARPRGRLWAFAPVATRTATPFNGASSILLRAQNEDGSWTEDYTTGTGFPCVFYSEVRHVSPALPAARTGDISKDVRPSRSGHADSSRRGIAHEALDMEGKPERLSRFTPAFKESPKTPRRSGVGALKQRLEVFEGLP